MSNPNRTLSIKAGEIMTQLTKPSAWALKVAIACMQNIPKSVNPITDLALSLDRETGVAELLEAAKETLVGAEGSDYSMVNSTLKLTQLRNAIVKCEGVPRHETS